MKRQLQIALLTSICTITFAQGPTPTNGFIPDEKTAIRVAEAVLSPIYGEDKIIGERPFHAQLENGIWTVSGSLPDGWVGGVAIIRIDQRTGKIISYIHGK
ncbi:MAG: NTF2 fold immunity protein [Acidobacteriota bacterium]